MTVKRFDPTAQQAAVIGHVGSAFVEACPGAGKTRVMVERARRLLSSRTATQGIAFLSFTNAAIDELASRLRREGIVSPTPFPHFLGTFDSFLWSFFVAPFGAPDCPLPPRLMPDMERIQIKPYDGARPLPLSCFDKVTGSIIVGSRDLGGFDPTQRSARAYETAAKQIRQSLSEKGFLDYGDVRSIALARIADSTTASRLAAALATRFSEVIVDEAQDCNPDDLNVIRWLRTSGIPTMVICDPHQSIYGFRGGVTDHLFAFRDECSVSKHLPMSGNFRSNAAICNGIVALRNKDHRDQRDEPLGLNKDDATPVHILSYRGTLSSAVGEAFKKLLDDHGIEASACPVLATTRDCGGNAIGQPASNKSEHMSIRLASAVSEFHFAGEPSERIAAMEALHQIILKMEGRLDGTTYRKYLSEGRIKPDSWRPRVISLMDALRYDATTFATPDAWLERARTVLAEYATGGRSMGQLLRSTTDLGNALATPSTLELAARTIHSVKGMEFPAVCVVLSTAIAKGVIDHLIDGGGSETAQENARKIYVAASRAERLLVFGVPHKQARRFGDHLISNGAQVVHGEMIAQ
ncbi:superfamily I DNA/RNA helicase [Rhodoblastus acidophilus]|uniref:UvrD-helicase domain-containing protein n=1 Tax=Rhodoblastus acidophilus TaxID=1074 RepID=UPI00222464AC|nr:ATP-dependent helicase [Rhodoblastus acidophilus]MCW2282593.1 superfamily I DNA/RNA helicase [Rhodoblastus acidophilus]MCW2331454.1 superfamily I DNA/RNA helicase [Rhodoblastus acidophilus]